MHQVTPLSGPLYVVAGVLVVAGATKVMTPAVTATALRRMRIPAPRLAARTLGGAELVIALVAIATGSPGAWGAVAGLYGAFTVFMIWALQDGGRIGSCGCFGQEDTPPTPGHAAFNAAATALAALAVSDPVRPGDLELSSAETAAFVILVATGIGLSVLAMTALPRLLAITSGEAQRAAVPSFSVDRVDASGP